MLACAGLLAHRVHEKRRLMTGSGITHQYRRPRKPGPFGSTAAESVDILSDNLTRPLRREQANVREDKPWTSSLPNSSGGW
jgi:hypothetical protein